MTVSISQDTILAEFDRRRQEGLIFYDDEPVIHHRNLNGFQFEFAVTPAISKKPYIKDNGDEPNDITNAATTTTKNGVAATIRPPGYAPGSDIDISGYEIGDVSPTHFLAFNKFCMYRPHLLLLTKDGYKRQYRHLELEDLRSAWHVLEALDWKYFLFFNCGKEGGCSRLHKHLQLTPNLPDRLAPWPERTPPSSSSSRRPGVNVPYRYILRRFDDSLGPKQLMDMYAQMIEEARQILGMEAATTTTTTTTTSTHTTTTTAAAAGLETTSPLLHVPHNFMLARNWMLVIPRRKAGAGGAYSNTLGLLGMVSVANNDELKLWLNQGPLEILEQIGVPRNKDEPGVAVENGIRN